MSRRRESAQDGETGDVKEVLTTDGRQVLYSTDPDTDEPAKTNEWLASDTTISGGEQQ